MTPLWLLMAGCGNGGDPGPTLHPVLAVAPPALDLGEVGVTDSKTASIFVTNPGAADLEVTVTLDGPDVFTLEVTGALLLAPDEGLELPVTFAPSELQEYEGEVLLESNDPDHPQWSVPLTGVGVHRPVPDIEISPSQTVETSLPYGTSSAYLAFDILNVGDDSLTLGVISVDGPDAFTPIVVPSSQVIQPGQRTQMIAEYATSSADSHEATVTIPSNDPDEPETTVQLIGHGGGP